MPHVKRTLDALGPTGARVLFIDSGSSDGSVETAERAGANIVRISPDAYIPGRVLNDAMRRTTSPVVAFVNADAVPLDPSALARLVDACRSGLAAAYGCQVPRQDAGMMTRLDYARAFPDDATGPAWGHFFSMAASAVRREVWQALPFDEDLAFSEDVDWTFRARALGLRSAYVPEAKFEHSHDYDRIALRRRMTGEGAADASIFRRGRPDPWRNLLAPFVAQLGRDASSGLPPWRSAGARWTAQRARFSGLARTAAGGPPRPARWVGEGSPFTRNADPRDEAIVGGVVDATLARAERTLGPCLIAAVLLGSFGCGDGAMDVRGDDRTVHNDLDFALVVRGRGTARALRSTCRELGEELTRELGATVDLWPVAAEDLRPPVTRLLWIDAAVRGVRVLRGSHDVFRGLEGTGTRSVVSDEIGRLLANRATGLALSRLAFDAGIDDAAAARHVAKAWFALGDAMLLWLDAYAAGLDARSARLDAFARVGGDFVRHFADGYAWACRFRQDPAAHTMTPAQLNAAADAMWPAIAALEAMRLGARRFDRPADYAETPVPIFDRLQDMTPAGRWLGGVRAALDGAISWSAARRPPRDSLARASLTLAFSEDRHDAIRWASAVLGTAAAPLAVRVGLSRLRDVAS